MKRLLVIAAVLAASTALCETSQAGVRITFGSGHGYYGNSYHGHGYHGGYNAHPYSYRSYGYAPVRHNTWHDTSHYDYHPGGFVRHRNHYDYVPGHYDYHRSGHWDTHYHH